MDRVDDLRLWAILFTTLGALLYNVISNYAIRGNELKHLNDAIKSLEQRLSFEIDQVLRRIERLENRILNRADEDL